MLRGPQRTLAIASFINMFGTGMFAISAVLYFTRVAGLSVGEVALGMGVSALVGLGSGIPVGRLADRRGPRGIYLITLCLQGVAAFALVFVQSFALFLVALCVGELARSASVAARGPLVRSIGGEQLTRFRAYLRSVANLAGALGAVAAGVVIQMDTADAYQLLIVGNALTFVACAGLTLRLPVIAAVPGPARGWAALRDRAYLVFTGLDGLLAMQYQVLGFALPLWIVESTTAPRWLVAVAAVANTVMVVLFQVRVSRSVESEAGAAMAMRRAGYAFLVGMGLVALASSVPGWGALVLILIGVGVHTIGELLHAAGSMELRFRLAPEHAQGQYSGVYGLGTGLINTVAPTVIALVCLSWGMPGWLLLGAAFLALGLLMPAAIRRAKPAPAMP
jgi:hypothetical protein